MEHWKRVLSINTEWYVDVALIGETATQRFAEVRRVNAAAGEATSGDGKRELMPFGYFLLMSWSLGLVNALVHDKGLEQFFHV